MNISSCQHVNSYKVQCNHSFLLPPFQNGLKIMYKDTNEFNCTYLDTVVHYTSVLPHLALHRLFHRVLEGG